MYKDKLILAIETSKV